MQCCKSCKCQGQTAGLWEKGGVGGPEEASTHATHTTVQQHTRGTGGTNDSGQCAWVYRRVARERDGGGEGILEYVSISLSCSGSSYGCVCGWQATRCASRAALDCLTDTHTRTQYSHTHTRTLAQTWLSPCAVIFSLYLLSLRFICARIRICVCICVSVVVAVVCALLSTIFALFPATAAAAFVCG